jgi:monoamine oxidase
MHDTLRTPPNDVAESSTAAAEPIPRDARIVILGAGPAGLSAAYFRSKHGFRNVTVFEKLGRVGGMCRSVTVHQHAIDLGAGLVAPDYDGTACRESIAFLTPAGCSTSTTSRKPCERVAAWSSVFCKDGEMIEASHVYQRRSPRSARVR